MSLLALHMATTLCFVAGKTGGHLLPAITMAYQEQKKDPSCKPILLSTGCDLDYAIMEKHKTIEHYIPCKLMDVPYQNYLKIPLFIGNIAWYFIQSIYALWHMQPKKIISFGGLNSIPVCFAGAMLRIPFELHELNVEPGKAITFLSYFTNTIYITFEETKRYFPNHTCILEPYPVRFSQQDRSINKENLLHKYHLDPHKKIIVLLGGSQGSTFLNVLWFDILKKYPEYQYTYSIIHQCGNADYMHYKKLYESAHIPALVFGYHESLQDFYQLADIIISRGGAGSLSEILFFEKKCICIPHETASTNHQIQNIKALQKAHPHLFQYRTQDQATAHAIHDLISQWI